MIRKKITDSCDLYEEISFVSVIFFVMYSLLFFPILLLFFCGIEEGWFVSAIDTISFPIFFIFVIISLVFVYLNSYSYIFKYKNIGLKSYLICIVKLITVVVAFITIIYSFNFMYSDFSKESWKTNKNERIFMIDDLIENYKVIGMNKEELINLLGEPDGIDDVFLDYSSGYVTIVFYIDNNDKVVSYNTW